MADNKTAIDLASGTAAGVTQLVVGHPLDSVKVVMQTSASGQASMGAAVRQIVSGGPLEVYKGMGAPLITVAAFNALLFASWGAAERLILGSEAGSRQMTPGQAALAGGMAGMPVSLLATPTELIKCKLQQQAGQAVPANVVYSAADYRAGQMMYRGPADVLRAALRYEGPLAVMRGLTATLLREMPGNAAYFGVYELVKQAMASSQGLASTSDLGAVSLMTAGGIGGAAFWGGVYPMDVIKTRIQTQNSFQPTYSGIVDAARKIVAAEGVAGLYRGFTPCLARAIAANSVAFLAYERVKQTLQRNE